MNKIFFYLSVLLLPTTFAATFVSCKEDKARLELRGKELQAIAKADQEDRVHWQNPSTSELDEMVKHDEVRRRRVGEIFGEGCFSKAADYAAAALVYQHGNTPDHFFQTFIWSKRGVDLGDKSQNRMAALGIDRYLVNMGQKQLFGSQAFKPGLTPDSCWCLQPVESSFPDNLRKQYTGKTYSEALDWLKELNTGKTCANKECATSLKPSPKGSIPGFW